jgi:hypothetical protein
MVVALLATAGFGCGGAKSRLSAEADLDDEQAGTNGGIGGDEGRTRPCGLGPPCDSTNLGHQTCETLGLRGGELSCDAETCFFDLKECGPGGLSSAPTGTPTGAGTAQPLPGTTTPLFGGGGGAGATDGGLFGGGLFGGQPGGPSDGGLDEDGGTGGPDGGAAPGFFGGGFFGGGFFGGGAGTGGGLFGGGLFGGGGTGGQGG